MVIVRRALLGLLVLILIPLLVSACSSSSARGDWRTASRLSAGLAPVARVTDEAVLQVYAARAFSWRGVFAVHTWIATKPAGANDYQVHQVIGFRARRGLPVVVTTTEIPDRAWYGAAPELLLDMRGESATAAIPKVLDAISRYPWADRYQVWPGPNSNTFTAFVAREVPELGLELPPIALGKDFLGGSRVVAPTASATGYQLSLAGALGVSLARAEGLELNLLGLVIGIDPLRPALKLPGVGRVGASM